MEQPDPERICTSIIERSNLSTRMSNRRFTRLTNAFSRELGNHWATVACRFAFYNFCRVYKSFRTILAMAAGVDESLCALCASCWRPLDWRISLTAKTTANTGRPKFSRLPWC
jgi:hypothetical protein